MFLDLYQRAALTCRGLPWTILAGIGTVESDNGRSRAPGVTSGANFAGAEGPMQFLASTFSSVAVVGPGGADPPNPYDPVDAVYSAARLLCSDGGGDPATLPRAIFSYNHSSEYVAQVLSLAQGYGGGAETGAAGAAGPVAADWSLGQVGTPYVFGGETPGVGFDCSGLAQAAYKAAGITLPRGAQDQFDAGAQLQPGASLEPGDLVFFGSGPVGVEHVGLYVGTEGGQAVMVDAPHTGADVRVESFPTVVGATWGSEDFVGATRPAAGR
jgi:hypothetical protein